LANSTTVCSAVLAVVHVVEHGQQRPCREHG
jgi:hypothetical protein